MLDRHRNLPLVQVDLEFQMFQENRMRLQDRDFLVVQVHLGHHAYQAYRGHQKNRQIPVCRQRSKVTTYTAVLFGEGILCIHIMRITHIYNCYLHAGQVMIEIQV